LDGLTSTQLKVLLNIADGRLNKQVAATLNVSEAAIKGHMTAIFRKLGVQNRSQAILAVRPLLAEGVAA
jgi:DNA-binding NarL/FixJ family response regulator